MTSPAEPLAAVVTDLLTSLDVAPALEDKLARALWGLVKLAGARAGALVFRPRRQPPVTALVGETRALKDWLPAATTNPPPRAPRVRPLPSRGRRGRVVLLEAPLGPPRAASGVLALMGPAGRLTAATLPAAFLRELGAAIARVWQLRDRTLRTAGVAEITRLGAGSESLDEVFRAFAEGVTQLVQVDSIGVSLLDTERGEFEVLDLPARSLDGAPRHDATMRLEGTLLERLVQTGEPLHVDDLAAADVPAASREAFGSRGYRSAVLVPLASRGRVFGAVTATARDAGAFDARDVQILVELAGPLASAIEQRRLLEESRRRTEELAALYRTSRLI